MTITAEVVLDSISPECNRLTTFRLRYPKFIHGEAKTHRMIRLSDEGGVELWQEVGFMDDPNLSRNASSSRAIPTRKLIEEVRSNNRAEPVFWGKNQPGMQSSVELEGYPDGNALRGLSPKMEVQIAWTRAAMNAAHEAEKMMELGAHKQIVNRILEPFLHINVICTATEYDNFFGLRLHRDAQPEMRALADAMWYARKKSSPKLLLPGEWHLPFIEEVDRSQYVTGEMISTGRITPEEYVSGDFTQLMRQVSVARCARISYLSHETGKRSTVEEDLILYDKLLSQQPLHASPAEHQATPDVFHSQAGTPSSDSSWWEHPEQHGNFTGWRQYRKLLPNESIAPLPQEYR